MQIPCLSSANLRHAPLAFEFLLWGHECWAMPWGPWYLCWGGDAMPTCIWGLGVSRDLGPMGEGLWPMVVLPVQPPWWVPSKGDPMRSVWRATGGAGGATAVLSCRKNIQKSKTSQLPRMQSQLPSEALNPCALRLVFPLLPCLSLCLSHPFIHFSSMFWFWKGWFQLSKITPAERQLLRRPCGHGPKWPSSMSAMLWSCH